jgi:hypothetical protein
MGESVDGVVNSYTSQDRTGVDHLKALVATTFDPELISVLVRSGLSLKDTDVHQADECELFPVTVPNPKDANSGRAEPGASA